MARGWFLVAGAGLLGLVVTSACSAGLSATPAPAPSRHRVYLRTVSAHKLRGVGITLWSKRMTPRVTKAAAARIALMHGGGSAVREEVLAQLIDAHQEPRVNKVCWVVVTNGSVAPSGGHTSATRGQHGHFIAFIGAHGGVFVEGMYWSR
jgi:hypothetical protein